MLLPPSTSNNHKQNISQSVYNRDVKNKNPQDINQDGSRQ